MLARLLGRNGNRVGAVLYDGGLPGSTRIVPLGSGRGHALRIGRELDRTPDVRSTATTDLAAMLDTVASLARRCLVVVISDFIGTGEWQRPLIRLAHRNDVVALRVVDRADDAIPEVGLIVVEDAETGEQLLVDSADPLFRASFRDGVDEREETLRSGTRRAGVPLHRVDTGDDLVEMLWLTESSPVDPPEAPVSRHEPSYPLLVLGLLVAAALAVAVVRLGRRRSAALAAAGIAVTGRRGRAYEMWFFVAGVVVLAVAVAGPAAALPVGAQRRHGHPGDGRVREHERRRRRAHPAGGRPTDRPGVHRRPARHRRHRRGRLRPGGADDVTARRGPRRHQGGRTEPADLRRDVARVGHPRLAERDHRPVGHDRRGR